MASNSNSNNSSGSSGCLSLIFWIVIIVLVIRGCSTFFPSKEDTPAPETEEEDVMSEDDWDLEPEPGYTYPDSNAAAPAQTSAPSADVLYGTVLAAYRNGMYELRNNHSVNVAGSFRFYNTVDTSKPLYYAIHDIDGNGTPELLIGGCVPETGSQIQIIDAFGLNQNTPVCLYHPIKSDYSYSPGQVPMFHEGEIPSYLRIFADGSICARIGAGNDPACYVRSRIAYDGYSLLTQEGLFANYTPMNAAGPNEPAYNYFGYSEDCPNPNTDYDDFIPYCLNLYGAPFLQSKAYGVQNDYDAWTIRYCTQYGAMRVPSWMTL